MTETLRSRAANITNELRQEVPHLVTDHLIFFGAMELKIEKALQECWDEAYAKGVASTKPKKPHCPKCNSDDVGLIFDPPSVVNREEDIYQCLKCKYESKDWNEWSPR